MTRWVLSVIAAVFTLAVVAVSVGWNAHEPKPPRRQVTEAERIIAYCSQTVHKDSPLCRVDAEDPEQVEDAVRDIIDRRTTGPQIIERERETVRQSDDDDSGPAPQVTVIQPSQEPVSSPSAAASRPPMQLDIPDLPDVPDLGDVQLPLLP